MKLKITAALLACFMLLAALSGCKKQGEGKGTDDTGNDIPLLTPGVQQTTTDPAATTTEPGATTTEATTTEATTTEATTTEATTTEATTTEATTTEPVDPLTFTACDETVYVTSGALNVRTAPTLDDNIYTQVAMGETLRRVGYNETWSKVVIENKEYYVSSKYVSTENPNAEYEFAARYETVYVTASLLNIRKSPSNFGEIVDTVAKGTEIIRIGFNEDWSKIMYNGDIYYAGSKYLSTEKPETQTPAQ